MSAYYWAIIGASCYGTEEIDSADNWAEARQLRAEYAMAFGPEWTISIKRKRRPCD